MRKPFTYADSKLISVAPGILCATILLLFSNPVVALCQMPAASTETRVPVGAEVAAQEPQELVKGFSLKGTGNFRLLVENAVAPTLKIASYTTGGERMTFIMGCLIATGAGLVFVAPLATVPAVIGPPANAAAGAAATGVAAGEAWSIDSFLGGSRAKVFREVVSSVDMKAHLKGSLERFLKVRDMPAEDAKGMMEVIITGYGFQTSREHNEACCFIDVHTLLREPDRDQITDRVFIGQGAEGDDLPPPHCTDLKRFLENDGSLARQAMIESAEIAAGVISHRLQRRQP